MSATQSMLAQNYTYSMEQVPGTGLVITLKRTADGATQVFKLAAGCPVGMARHMNSLTDACCDGWFKPAKQPTKGSK